MNTEQTSKNIFMYSKVVFGLEKRISKPPISQRKADLWDILKALAPPGCISM